MKQQKSALFLPPNNGNQVTNIFGAGTTIYKFAKLEVKDDPEQAITDMTLQFTTVSSIDNRTPYLIQPGQNVNGFSVENATIHYVYTMTGESVQETRGTIKCVNGNYSVTMEAWLTIQTAVQEVGNTSHAWLGEDRYIYTTPYPSMKSLRATFHLSYPTGGNSGGVRDIRARVALDENEATGLDNTQLPMTNIQKVIENG